MVILLTPPKNAHAPTIAYSAGVTQVLSEEKNDVDFN
jgi:hypothetical protein